MLKNDRCRPQSGAPLTDEEVQRLLQELVDWRLVDGAIEKQFRFPGFLRTMAFINAVAWIAHAEDHHPDMSVGYDRCTLRYRTHSVKGLSINDFICAAKVDALLTP